MDCLTHSARSAIALASPNCDRVSYNLCSDRGLLSAIAGWYPKNAIAPWSQSWGSETEIAVTGASAIALMFNVLYEICDRTMVSELRFRNCDLREELKVAIAELFFQKMRPSLTS
ncbi:MAG: hypothetical protein ACTS2F_10745 [Thainema sp.]